MQGNEGAGQRAGEGGRLPAGRGTRGVARSALGSARYPNAGSARSSATRGGEWQVLATSLRPRELKEGGREKPRRAAGRWIGTGIGVGVGDRIRIRKIKVGVGDESWD